MNYKTLLERVAKPGFPSREARFCERAAESESETCLWHIEDETRADRSESALRRQGEVLRHALANIFRTLGLALVMLLTVLVAYADVDHDISVPEVLERIAETQGVTSERDIVCEDVSDEDLELLGDALMQRMIGDEDLHTQMDNMMGGEGSETLTAMHEHMARTYLGCSDSGFGMGMMMGGGMMQSMMGGGPMGMMPGNMMGSQGLDFNQRSPFNNTNSFGSMMPARQSLGAGGGFNTMGLGAGWLGGIVMIAFWVLVIAGIVLLIQKLTSRDDTRDRDRHTSTSALDILKERYARGEIDQKEFEQKKKDIGS